MTLLTEDSRLGRPVETPRVSGSMGIASSGRHLTQGCWDRRGLYRYEHVATDVRRPAFPYATANNTSGILDSRFLLNG